MESGCKPLLEARKVNIRRRPIYNKHPAEPLRRIKRPKGNSDNNRKREGAGDDMTTPARAVQMARRLSGPWVASQHEPRAWRATTRACLAQHLTTSCSPSRPAAPSLYTQHTNVHARLPPVIRTCTSLNGAHHPRSPQLRESSPVPAEGGALGHCSRRAALFPR